MGFLDIPHVYPRVCGGTGLELFNRLAFARLSPRVRGNRGNGLAAFRQSASIPACAGEPRIPPASGTGTAVYPRVCGGTGRTGHAPARPIRLSPRVRGNPLDRSGVRQVVASIPACAGEPELRDFGLHSCRVYPRVCGGTSLAERNVNALARLSPRVRGNPDQADQMVDRYLSIPACAGEPYPLPPRDASERVYPRVCGGTY